MLTSLLKLVNNHTYTNEHKSLGKTILGLPFLLPVTNWYTCQRVNIVPPNIRHCMSRSPHEPSTLIPLSREDQWRDAHQ